MQLACLLLISLFAFQGKPEDERLPLGLLPPECRLTKRWIGSVFELPWGVWLDCGGSAFLVVHPLNLLGHVTIKTPEQALEFVRFFSNRESHDLFLLDNMVEVLPARHVAEKSGFNELDPEVFAKHFQKAVVRKLPRAQPAQKGQSVVGIPVSEFEVRRVVVLPDHKIYEIVEVVSENGFYQILSRDVVFNDATKLGIWHILAR
ncbi:MAG: hypothetical protein ACRDFW_10180 [bacterium]